MAGSETIHRRDPEGHGASLMVSMPPRTQIHQMAARWLAADSRPEDLRIHTDTSDFFALDAGDVVVLNGRPYLVRNSIREGRFGLEDEIKYWVKRAIDLASGAMRIIKLVFYERFEATIGGITFECFRSPRKEARILELVNDHPNFMHGSSVADEKGNIVRVLETISAGGFMLLRQHPNDVCLTQHPAPQKFIRERGITVMIYERMLSPYHNGKRFDIYRVSDAFPKDVILTLWSGGNTDKEIRSRLFCAHGLGSRNWDDAFELR